MHAAVWCGGWGVNHHCSIQQHLNKGSSSEFLIILIQSTNPFSREWITRGNKNKNQADGREAGESGTTELSRNLHCQEKKDEVRSERSRVVRLCSVSPPLAAGEKRGG